MNPLQPDRGMGTPEAEIEIGQPLVGILFMRLSTLSCAMICTAVCEPPGVLIIVQL